MHKQTPDEKGLFEIEAKNIKTNIKNNSLVVAIHQCNALLKKVPSMKKDIYGLKYEIAQKSKSEKTKMYVPTYEKYITVFQNNYFFIDNEGNELVKLGKWNDVNNIGFAKSVFAVVENEKQEKYLLDTTGKKYLLAESFSELKAKDKKYTALKLTGDETTKNQVLPEDIFEQTQLKVLIINGYEISGISPKIGNLINLEHLDLSRNKIYDLPSSFAKLVKLNYINLAQNSFSHKPQVLEKFSKISFFNVEIDEISGLFDGTKAEFPGGHREFKRHLLENYNYPRKARTEGLEGTIFVEVIVEKDGSISDVKIFRGLSPDCDEEAIRIIKLVPKWTPAKKRGEAVRNRIVVPINLKLGG